jgi:hypothetical protein
LLWASAILGMLTNPRSLQGDLTLHFSPAPTVKRSGRRQISSWKYLQQK